MEYNKTKRGLELASAVLQLIFSVGIAFVFVFMPAVSLVKYGGDNYNFSVFMLCLLLAVVGIVGMVFCILCLKKPIGTDGTVKRRTVARVFVLVLSLLNLNFVSFGMMIAVLKLKDMRPIKVKAQNDVQEVPKSQTEMDKVVEFYKDLKTLKALKKYEVIDLTTYNKKVTKLITDIVLDK